MEMLKDTTEAKERRRLVEIDEVMSEIENQIYSLDEKSRVEVFDKIVKYYFSELEDSFCSVHDIDLIRRK